MKHINRIDEIYNFSNGFNEEMWKQCECILNERNNMNITKESTDMRTKKYGTFSAENINGGWKVVTVPDGIIIATIPGHIAYPAGVARALAEALTKSKFVLTDLI